MVPCLVWKLLFLERNPKTIMVGPTGSSSIETCPIKFDYVAQTHRFLLCVPGGVSCGTISQLFRWLLNLWLRYSPPRSDRRALIFLPRWFSTSLWNSLNFHYTTTPKQRWANRRYKLLYRRTYPVGKSFTNRLCLYQRTVRHNNIYQRTVCRNFYPRTVWR